MGWALGILECSGDTSATHTHTDFLLPTYIPPTTRLLSDALLASDPLCTGQEEIGTQCSAYHHTVQSSALQSELASWSFMLWALGILECSGNGVVVASQRHWWPASDTSATHT